MAKKILLTLNDPNERMLNDLIEKTGAINLQDAMRRCITAYHQTLFPAYTQKITTPRAQRTPEERAQEEIEKKKAIEENKKESALMVCDALGGTIIGSSCHFKTYSKMYGNKIHEGAQAVPLDILTDDYLDRQYINTSKEEVQAQ
jgi:hypothetical protein